MTTATVNNSLSTRRAASRNRHYANTLVHYLGVKQALKVCRENMWHSVHRAIMDQYVVEERAA